MDQQEQIDGLQAQVRLLQQGLKEAVDTFAHYAELHKAKGTHDGNLKAEANAQLSQKLASIMDTTLEQCLTKVKANSFLPSGGR